MSGKSQYYVSLSFLILKRVANNLILPPFVYLFSVYGYAWYPVDEHPQEIIEEEQPQVTEEKEQKISNEKEYTKFTESAEVID